MADAADLLSLAGGYKNWLNGFGCLDFGYGSLDGGMRSDSFWLILLIVAGKTGGF